MAKQINNLLIPNVSKVPGQKEVDLTNRLNGSKESKKKAIEFKGLLEKEVKSVGEKHGINLSIHAARRMKERNLSVNGDEFFKIKDAIQKLKEKGGKDSLVITKNAAYIVDVANNKVVTAIDKENMGSNVFTKIDSTVFVD
ncbi:MAG: hypothetical protein KAG61_03790 [Bacteriovoracaceae bacterium]|nr:hypothetical protein [Bacteriovoracaceae bacterium]